MRSQPTTPEAQRHPVRRLAPILVLVLALALGACGTTEPGTVERGPVPTKAQLASSITQATKVAEGVFKLIGRNDVRVCRLLEQSAQRQLVRATKTRSCAESVRAAYRRAGAAGRKRLLAMKFDKAKATSRIRVELTRTSGGTSRRIVAELLGSGWVITSIG